MGVEAQAMRRRATMVDSLRAAVTKFGGSVVENAELIVVSLPGLDFAPGSTSVPKKLLPAIHSISEAFVVNANDFDLMIGASALTTGYCVVTNNERHYSRIPGVTVVNWTREDPSL